MAFDPLPRRGFLCGLTTLPLIGGSVALVGTPTRAAVPVTDTLFERYATWVAWEHAEIIVEREARKYRNDPLEAQFSDFRAKDRRRWGHELYRCPADPIVGASVLASAPSTRAAVILSAAGVPLA